MYFKTIQFLRCIAALYITLFHIIYWWNYKNDGFNGLFNNGYGAIDLFFVISGFVVVQTASKFKTGVASFFTFLKKRFIRIYPIYWLFVLLFIITGILDPAGRTTFQIWQAVLLLPGHRNIILTSWTLPYELYFYVLIGLCILNRRFKFLLYALFLLSLVSFIGALAGTFITGWRFPVSGLYNEFVAEFFLGVIVWKIFQKVPFAMAVFLSLAGLVLFFIPAKVVPSHVISFGIPAALLLTGLTALELQQKIKIPAFMVLLGDASFCLYLIHLPLINFVLGNNHTVYNTNRILLLLFVVALCILSVLLYRYIESPLLRFLNRHWAPETLKNKQPVKEL